jgi:hypothetical protein
MSVDHRSEVAQATDQAARGPRSRRARRVKRVWVQDVDVNVALLEARLDTLRARREVARCRLAALPARRRRSLQVLQSRIDAESSLDRHVRDLLVRAHDAAHKLYPVPNPVMNWWGGRLIEAAYQNLHAAEAAMAGLYDWDELEAEAPEAIARVEASLQRDDPRRQAAYVLATLDRDEGRLGQARAALTKAIAVGHAVSDKEHSRLRNFRNAVLASGLVIGLLLVVFAAYLWFNPEKVPLCFTPPNAEGDPATWVCPTGEYAWDATTPTVHGPTSSHDVLVILLLGVLGGALSAAVSIRGLTGSPTPYDVPLALAVLKVPLGAMTALGALIALQGDFVPGLSELDSQGQILAYALVFGYAQQLLSGLLDRRAASLMESSPGKERDVAFTPQPGRPPVRAGGPDRGPGSRRRARRGHRARARRERRLGNA